VINPDGDRYSGDFGTGPIYITGSDVSTEYGVRHMYIVLFVQKNDAVTEVRSVRRPESGYNAHGSDLGIASKVGGWK
jgi:hypothetical protein